MRHHPDHVAVRAGIEECAQPFRRKRDGVRPRDADDVKTERARLRGEFALERFRRQKSRLA
jgi:hypothetical protein